MTENRRDFFKIVLGGSASLLTMAEFLPQKTYAQDGAKSDVKYHTGKFSFEQKSLKTDVLVAGGGLSGVCAAIAAARNGASVILVQNRSRLGGNASSEIRMHVLGANNHEPTKNWRETGIIEELKLTEAATNPQRSFEIWDFILYDKVISEKNITLLLDTSVIDASVQGDTIKSISAISPLLEEYYDIEADFFIDCTGDATLAAVAGAQYMRGREGQDVFGESLAPLKSDNKTMGNSLMFFSKQHDQPMPFKKPDWARTFTKKDFQHRGIRSWEYGYWWIELGGEMDTIKDNRTLRHELLKVVFGVWDYIKNSGEYPASANWALDWVGMIPGKRESRRIMGDHVMIQQEMEKAELYPDRVAYGGWPIDDHAPEGMNNTDQKPNISIKFQKPYQIPLRSLYSKNRPNLLMAGRNISASHVAFSSTRVMATCATMGQAAGTAAAWCESKKCFPKDIVANQNNLQSFQQLLLKNDQSLININNEDPNDLARLAKIRASSETRDGKAQSVTDGWNRHIKDGKTHQWQAPMTGKEPWIELEWDNPQKISEIQITFDTGLSRKLYLSGQDSEYNKQIRKAQPETVSDYTIEVVDAGTFNSLVSVKDNYLRMVCHKIKPVSTRKLRFRIQKTNGDNLARIFEIRCYA